MARYDFDVLICHVNPDGVRAPARVPAQEAEARPSGIELAVVDGEHGVSAVRVGRGGHTCGAIFDPPLQDLRAMPDPGRRDGVVELQADRRTELRARYEIVRAGDRVEVVIEDFGPWRTRSRRPLLAVLFRLPLFRRWPATYRWHATLDLTPDAEEVVTSRWTRGAGR